MQKRTRQNGVFGGKVDEVMTLKILYISALPRDQHSIPVEGEFKAILDARAKSEYKTQIDIRHWPGISLADFQGVIEAYKPNVLHFSGHASNVGDLAFQGPEEESQKVPKDPFTYAFKLLGESIKLVVLSACYSKDQAEGIVKHVDRVVGIDKDIEGDKATMFSKKFYESMFDSDGKSVEDAFDIARNELSMNVEEGESVPNPVLLKNSSRKLSPLLLIDTPRKQLNIYLNHIVDETSHFVERTDFHSEHRPAYIENRRGTIVPLLECWNTEDTKLENGEVYDRRGDKIEIKITDTYDLVQEFLKSGSSDPYLIIGAPFGTGKSALVRKIAYELAKKRLNNENNDIKHIPILVSNTNAIDNYYQKRKVEEILQNVVAPYDKNKQILIIFDGIDEYKDGIREFLKRIRSEPFTEYGQRKIILTTRLNSEFPEEYGATDEDKYLRLLPFSVPQVNEFFKHLHTDLTYQKALEFGVNDEDIRKPLLAFILCRVYKENKQDLLKLNEERILTSNEYRAFIYINFIHQLIEGKLHQSRSSNKPFVFEEYTNEKDILRKIALLIKLFKENLTENVILDENSVFKEFFGLNIDKSTKGVTELQKVLHYYFNISPIENGSSSDRRILFLHSTFKEYLMAENYIAILLSGREEHSYWMNVTIPTKESMQFLEGLIGLIKKKSNSETIRKWINKNNNEGSLFNSFKYDGNVDESLNKIFTNSRIIVNDEAVPLLMIGDFGESKDNRKIHFLKEGTLGRSSKEHLSDKYKQLSINEHQNLWIRRWIALYVMTIIDPVECWKQVDNKSKLEMLIIQTDNIIPGYMKNFAHADLSGLVLSAVKFSHANLYKAILKADLTGASFYKANLDEANLEGAHLGGANLSEATMKGATLNGAYMNGTICYRTDLSGSFLIGTHLIGSHLNNAIFYDAKMMEATITAATAYYAIFTRANLSKAKITYSNIVGCDFRDAIMNGTRIYRSNTAEAYLPSGLQVED